MKFFFLKFLGTHSQSSICSKTALLFPVSTLNSVWGVKRNDASNLQKVILENKVAIRNDIYNMVQWEELDDCVRIVNYVREQDNCSHNNVQSIIEQEVKVDLLRWEFSNTLENLSRAVGIEPVWKFNWVDDFLHKMGFASPIQNYKDVKAAFSDPVLIAIIHGGEIPQMVSANATLPKQELPKSAALENKSKTPTKDNPKHKTLYEAIFDEPTPIPPVSAGNLANIDNKTVNKKLRDYIEVHPGSESWTCTKLGEAIGVSGDAVRQTKTWKFLSKDKKYSKIMNAIALRLKDERLTFEERKKLENQYEEANESQRKLRVGM